MDSESALKLYSINVDYSHKVLDAGFSVDEAELAMMRIVRLVRDYPEVRANFLIGVEAVLALTEPSHADNGLPPVELIELIAHELQLHTVAALADLRIRTRFHGNSSLAIGDLAGRIFEAMRPDWPDRIFYKTYQRGS